MIIPAEQFYSMLLVTLALGITGTKEIVNRNYFLGAFMIGLPLIGWATFALKTLGWLT